jgi:hypothetical protein
LSADVRCRIEKLSESGCCIDPGPSCLVGTDNAGNYRALAYIRVTEQNAVFSLTGMRPQRFRVPTSEVLESIAVHDLFENLMEVLDGRQCPVAIEVLRRKLDEFRGKFTEVCSSTCGDPLTPGEAGFGQ